MGVSPGYQVGNHGDKSGMGRDKPKEPLKSLVKSNVCGRGFSWSKKLCVKARRGPRYN